MIFGQSKQERLKEIPTSATTISDGNFYGGTDEQLNMLPGSEFDHPLQSHGQVGSCSLVKLLLGYISLLSSMSIYVREQNFSGASALQIRVDLQMLGMRYIVLNFLMLRVETVLPTCL